MQIIRRKALPKWAFIGGPLLILYSLFQFYDAHRRLGDEPSQMGTIGVYLGAVLWFLFGLGSIITQFRSKNVPAGNYDQTRLKIFKPRALGPHDTFEIPLADITRFQLSEPGSVAIYFRKNGDETIKNLIGNADDITAFQNSINVPRS